MKSPAQRHYERVSAELAAASAAPGGSLAGASAYELMLAKLATDRRRLKAIQSIERKIDVKRAELLPEYVEYVAGALRGGRGAQDDVLTTVMIWRIDAGDFAGALDIARYALAHRMTLPDQYDRPLATAIAEEFAQAALAAFKLGETFDASQLAEVMTLTESADMHDQVRAKLHKALGKALQESDSMSALDHLRRALQLDERAGVKQDIARLEAESGNAAGTKAGRK
ncbi:phage terminase small subunit [Paraburkholderia fungorum]|uniref:phage terminase small subunit n=1 Tax=Paraburkholderia fungorum TaxID=134537 RepID=UPI0004ABD268|nr:phage terminase small subunit [Paraburkholderia fungorum]KFX61019.1 terminase [Burkholderia sp. K24]USX10859.1 phage terminase small subunit [Paraburkholderia fungorum]